MSRQMTIECSVDFGRRDSGKREVGSQRPQPASPGRVPRIARLMALAIRYDQQVCQGAIASYADLARLGHVTRARMSQIMNLLNLAPDVQEAILFLPRTERGRDPIHVRQLQPIALCVDWRKQRRLWKGLGGTRTIGVAGPR